MVNPEGWIKKNAMKTIFLRSGFILILLSFSFFVKGIDSLKYSFSLNYYKDLSDTYSGGNLLSGEFAISRSWYGASISYGHFQSHTTSIYQILIEEVNKTFEIPTDEISIMQMGSLSGLLIPIQKKWITTELVFGVVLGKAQSSRFKNAIYSYNVSEEKFTYLYKDYELVKNTHFGYQAGINITLNFSQKIGLQLNSRIQHLSNGGSFFFIGTGLRFNL